MKAKPSAPAAADQMAADGANSRASTPSRKPVIAPPFTEPPFPPDSGPQSLIYLSQTDCVFCGSELRADPAQPDNDEQRIDRLCEDCGTRYYSVPGDEPAMRTRELITWRPDRFQDANEVAAERRRSYLLANLSRRLNRLTSAGDQERGYGFQDAIAKLFRIEGMTWEPGYRRSETEVDGAVDLDGWYYLVETRWRRRPANWSDLETLRAKVRRSSRQTMGLFMSMSGWTPSASETLRAGGEQAVLLVGREDIAVVLAGTMGLAELLRAKARHLALFGEPYLSPSAMASARAPARRGLPRSR